MDITRIGIFTRNFVCRKSIYWTYFSINEIFIYRLFVERYPQIICFGSFKFVGFINWLMRSIVFLVCYGYLSVRTFNCFSWNSVLCIGKQQHQDSNIQMRSMICISVLTWSYSSGLWINDMAINMYSSYWLNWNQTC